MRWQSETFEQKYIRLRKWHKWFAWHPVRLDSDNKKTKVWFEHVGRKFAPDTSVYNHQHRWHYCDETEIEFNILKDDENTAVNSPPKKI